MGNVSGGVETGDYSTKTNSLVVESHPGLDFPDLPTPLESYTSPGNYHSPKGHRFCPISPLTVQRSPIALQIAVVSSGGVAGNRNTNTNGEGGDNCVLEPNTMATIRDDKDFAFNRDKALALDLSKNVDRLTDRSGQRYGRSNRKRVFVMRESGFRVEMITDEDFGNLIGE